MKPIPGSEFAVAKSDLQKRLEADGHFMVSQSIPLSAHETDRNKDCFCGRKAAPQNGKEKG